MNKSVCNGNDLANVWQNNGPISDKENRANYLLVRLTKFISVQITLNLVNQFIENSLSTIIQREEGNVISKKWTKR